MSANGRRSERDRRLQELSDRKTAVAEQREKLAEEIDDVDIDPQRDIKEIRTKEGVKLELTQKAQQRLDRAQFDQFQESLPSQDDILFARASPELTNVVLDLVKPLRGGAIGDRADVGVVTGGGNSINDIPDSGIEAVETADPEAAEDYLGIDADRVRRAQDEIDSLRSDFNTNPDPFISEFKESPEQIVEKSYLVQQGLERGSRRRSAAWEREDEITEKIASENNLLTPDDISVSVDPRNFNAEVDVNRDAVEQRQRKQLRAEAAEEAGVDQSLIDISRSNDRLEASIDRDAQKQQFRRETASEYGVDVSDVSVELADDELRAEIRRDRGRRQQQAEEQQQIELPGDEEDFVETNEFGKVSAPTGFEDPLAPPEETKLEQQINMVQPALDNASEAVGPRLRDFGSSAGSAIATLSPVPAFEEAVFGTNRLESAYEGAGEEAFSALNAPAAASGTLDAAEFVAEGPDRGSRTEVATETATAAVNQFSEAATERPVETTGRAFGALAGGFGVGAVVSRGARGASSARRLVDMDFDEFTTSTRAQADLDFSGQSVDDTVEIADSDRFSPIPDDAAEQRRLSTDNPRMSASEAGERRVIDEQIEAGRRQEPPELDDRPSPSGPDREIRTVSRQPRTGPAEGTQPRGRFNSDADLSPLETQLAAQMDTPDVDARAVDRAGRVPEDDLRAVAEMDRSVPREVEIDRGGVVGAGGGVVSSGDVGEVTGSPTLTGEQTPETEQTLFETSRGDSRSDATVESQTQTRTRTEIAADTDLRGMSLGLLGLNNQSATDSALDVDTSARGAVGSRSRSGTVSDLVTDIGVDVGPASRVTTGASAAGATGATARTGTTTTANRPTPATRGPLTRLLPTRPTRPQPRAPDLPETEQSDDRREESLDFFGSSADRRSAGAGPAAGWFGETLDAFATGAFGDRRLPAQGGAAPGGVGLELPTATIADPSEEQQDDVAAVFDFFGLGAGTPQSGQEADGDDGEWLI